MDIKVTHCINAAYELIVVTVHLIVNGWWKCGLIVQSTTADNNDEEIGNFGDGNNE